MSSFISQISRPSCKNSFDNTAMYISKSQVAPTISVSQIFMIYPHQVQHGGPQIVNVALVLGDMIAELVGRPVGGAPLGPAACHPNTVAERVVVAAIATLREWRPAKFTRPNDERLVEQASRF